jgi:hypothetical protein
MATFFADVWLNVVRRLITKTDQAPWLDGIEELPHSVVVTNENSDSEQNIVTIPLTEFEPDVLYNNTSYPIAVQQYTDSAVTIALGKFQTLATSLSDDQLIGATYDRIESATKGHRQAMLKDKYKRAIHALAPASNATLTPVFEATGATIGSRKRLTYEDLVEAQARLDAQEAPDEGRRAVLSSDHWNDLSLFGSDEVKKQLFNYQTGQPAPMIAGFKIYKYTGNPFFTNAGAKVPYNAVPAASDRKASVIFLESNTVKKTGLTKQYYSKSGDNPTTQTNLLAYRHYFICLPLRARNTVVIY